MTEIDRREKTDVVTTRTQNEKVRVLARLAGATAPADAMLLEGEIEELVDVILAIARIQADAGKAHGVTE